MAAAGSATGCGQQAFLTTDNVEQKQGPGNFVVPPKIDLILAQDDTAGISELRNEMRVQMPAFLNQLESKGWDYRFATVPLTTDRELTQVVASRYDSNWGTAWLPPFPGALEIEKKNPGTFGVNAFLFRKPEQYTGFIDFVNQASGSIEDAFANIDYQLNSRLAPAKALREDALQVVLVVGTGEDTSNVNFCWSDFFNRNIPCGSYPETGAAPKWDGTTCTTLSQTPGGRCDSRALSANHYRDRILGMKVIPQLSRVYAAVSTAGGSMSSGSARSCRSGYAFNGARYINLANATGGKAYDICSQPVSSVLDQLGTELQSARFSFRTRYVFVASEPDPDTIRVIKYVGGDTSKPVELFRSSLNGWTYAGWRNDIYAIDFPVQMNQGSGWTIELHGSAKAMGDDRIEVLYKPLIGNR